LKDQSEEIDRLLKLAARRRIALIYGARDERHNEAVVLKSLLESRRAKSARAKTELAASSSEARS
jgi:hypothetical protein